MEQPTNTAVSCALFERRLFHFQADELPEAERRVLCGHLDACPECARRLEIEDALLRSLKARLRHAEPPAELLVRVRAGLVEERAPTAWFRVAWFAAAAASLLLAGVLVRDLGSGVRSVFARVTLVDEECDRAGLTLDQQRQCAHPQHLNALRVSTGHYWSISRDDGRFRELVIDRERRGHLLEVEGDLYPEIHTVKIDIARDLGRAAAYAGGGRGSAVPRATLNTSPREKNE